MYVDDNFRPRLCLNVFWLSQLSNFYLLELSQLLNFYLLVVTIVELIFIRIYYVDTAKLS